MAIPAFNKTGSLDKGIHECTPAEFFERFCYGKDTVRRKYKEVLEQLFAFCVSRGVKSVIIAGSFVTHKPDPGDLDCIVICPNDASSILLPRQIEENLDVEGCELDVLFAAESNKAFIYSLVNMFALNEHEVSVGMTEVLLDPDKDGSTWDDYEDYHSVETLMEAREAYINRTIIRGTRKKKMLITVCNGEEFGLWNYEIAPIVSASGWIFAPYYYTSKSAAHQAEDFKSFILEHHITYDTRLCVFADGLGTYMLGKYLSDHRRHKGQYFDKIVLSKAVLNPAFQWAEELAASSVKLVINLLDVGKQADFKENPEKKIKQDPIYGDAYRQGFSHKHNRLIEHRYDYANSGSVGEFQKTILPLFHISDAIHDNFRREEENHYARINEILMKEIKRSDLFKR